MKVKFQDPRDDTIEKVSAIDESKKKNQAHLEKIFANNKGYFAHFMRNCLCGMCTCGQCRCDYSRSLKLPVNSSNNSSVYRHDYNWKAPNEYRLVKPPVELCPAYQNIIANSVYRNDFKVPKGDSYLLKHNFKIEPRNKDNEHGTKHIKAPFPQLTTSKENYLDWECKRPVIIGAPRECTTDGRFPLFAKPANAEYGNFKRSEIEATFDAKLNGKPEFKNPIGPDLNLGMTTMNHTNYQNPKSLDLVFRRHSQASTVNHNMPTFKNQFRTSYQNHDQPVLPLCPSRKILNEMSKFKTIV